MTWDASAVAVGEGSASTALTAWAALVRTVRSAAPANRLDDARFAVASVLMPSGPGSVPTLAAVLFAEQMTADVSIVSEDQRAEALAELGSSALPFVQAVWVCDIGTRARRAFHELFGSALIEDLMSEGPMDAGSAWSAQEQFLREVARLRMLDPVTSELVRLRGARAHACRLCQSLRNRAAVQAAGGAELFDAPDAYEHGDLSARHNAALRLVDCFIWQPTAWPNDLADEVRDLFSPDEAIELVLDLVRNSANKIAVALAADAAHVTDGVEYYDIDSASGELLYGLSAD